MFKVNLVSLDIVQKHLSILLRLKNLCYIRHITFNVTKVLKRES